MAEIVKKIRAPVNPRLDNITGCGLFLPKLDIS